MHRNFNTMIVNGEEGRGMRLLTLGGEYVGI
jgi:hypothetical protein